MREPDAQRGHQDAEGANQRRRAVANDALAQSENRRQSGGNADGQQPDWACLAHRQTQTEDEQRHGDDSAAGAADGEDEADDAAEENGRNGRIDHEGHGMAKVRSTES